MLLGTGGEGAARPVTDICLQRLSAGLLEMRSSHICLEKGENQYKNHAKFHFHDISVLIIISYN